jgi:hypothetical protein
MASDLANEYWRDESEGMWIDTKKVASTGVDLVMGKKKPRNLSSEQATYLDDLEKALGLEPTE